MPITAANSSVAGRATVQVELKLPNSKFLSIGSINISHISSSVSESVRAASTHTFTVRAPTTDYVDNILRYLQSQGKPLIRYRIGVGTPGNMQYLPWQNHIVTSFTGVVEGLGESSGHFLNMTTQDSLYAVGRSIRVKSRRGLVSDIVQEIASESNITDVVIEPTVGEGLYVQDFVDSVDFIRMRMLTRAINSKGRGNYNFYIQDNTLHFHSPDYQAQLKELPFYQSNNISLSQMDESQNMLEYGASGVRISVFDPYTGSMAEIISDPTKALRLGNTITPLGSVERSALAYPMHISTNTRQEAQNIAQTVYERARMRTMGLKLEIARSIFLRVGDLVQVALSPSASKSSVWSGVYFVTDATYQIENGALLSVFILQRGEFQTSSQTPASVNILGDNVVIDNTQAPGQPLNMKAVSSSSTTHGAGQSASTSVFVTTQSTDTAPNPNPKV